MQLYHYPYKLGTGEIYHVIYIYPLDIAIEAYLGEDGEVGKSFSERANYFSHPERSACSTKWKQESYLTVELVL